MKAMMIGMAVFAVMAVSPRAAQAQMSMGSFQGYATGHVGAIFGGDLSGERVSGGGSVSVHEHQGWGAEFDFSHAGDVPSGRQRLGVTTYLVNASFVKPAGTVRPFAVVGAGVLQLTGCDSPCGIPARTYDLGMNVGGGAVMMVNEIFAIRGDVRYIFSSGDHRDLNRPDNFRFWRATVGVTYAWAIAP